MDVANYEILISNAKTRKNLSRLVQEIKKHSPSSKLLALAQKKLRDIEKRILTIKTKIQAVSEREGKVPEKGYNVIVSLNMEIDNSDFLDDDEKRNMKLLLIKKQTD